ncbi:MAG: restriction endonuclease subunit S [Candidatus Bruticola sp.]
MVKKKNVPQVRFSGHSDEWVKYQFGDILDKYEDPVATPHDGYERLGVRSHVKGTFHSYVAPGSELETAQMHRVAADKLLFNITFAWEHAVAITDETDAGKLVSHRFPQFTFVPEMEPKFFRYVVADDKFRYHLWLSSPGGAGRNRVLNIPEMLEYQTYLPQKAEQIQLADWFSNLDAVIVQHQSKLEKLQNLKSSMLDKMFPKDGANVPEVRFKEFYGDWEQRKLGEVCNSFEYGLNAAAKEFDGTHKYIRITDIDDDRRVFLDSDLTSPDCDLCSAEKYKLQDGDIVFARTGASVGKTFIYKASDGLVFYAGFLIRAKINANTYPDFVFYNTFTKKYKRFICITSQRSGQPGINAQEYSSFEFLLPSYEEQQKIGSYFRNLDHLITLHRRELEKLQSVKKALLEKMFV